MKNLAFVAILSFFSLSAMAQKDEPATREISIEELMQMHRGTAEKFRVLLHRFAVAVDETEYQSASVLKDGLTDIMSSQVSYNLNMAAIQPENAVWKKRYKAQLDIYEETLKARISFESAEELARAAQLKTHMEAFVETMEKGLADIETYLRNN